MTYWLKLIGASEHPINPNIPFTLERYHMFFPTRPLKMCQDDIFILYAVGTKGMLISACQLKDCSLKELSTTKESTITPEEIAFWEAFSGDFSFSKEMSDRWKYYYLVDNIVPAFSRTWSAYRFLLSDLESSFKQKHPRLPLTQNGKMTVSIGRGTSQVALSKEFGKYILDKMLANIKTY
jgi:hypothetical protein